MVHRFRWYRLSYSFLLCVFALFFVAPPSFSQQTAEESVSPPQALGTDACLLCHGPSSGRPATAIFERAHGIGANPQTPFGASNHGCETCHGPSAQHVAFDENGKRKPPTVVFDDTHTAKEKNGVCLNCHQSDVGKHWAGSEHQFEELACVSCHQIHIEKDPVLTLNQQPSVCFTCHQQQRAELMRSSAHPVMKGSLSCADCHATHGSSGPSLLKSPTLNQTCFNCHAEKRGPFLWEHAPVQEDCSNCHQPHGSNHDGLLVARPPWLCQQCHQAQFHPSTALSGESIPPRGASQLLLNRNCLNCHSQIHGSNHPSGPGLIR